MSIPENPYASPESAIEPQIVAEGELADAERTRRQYLSHEASILSVGSLYYISAIVPAMVGFMFLSDREVIPAIVAGFIVILAIFVGRAIRKLEPWSRIPVGLLSTLGLLGFPVGTIINGYILYLFFSRKGQVCFSPEYGAAIRQTPHIKYRTSPIVIFFVVLLALVMILGLSAFLFSGIRE